MKYSAKNSINIIVQQLPKNEIELNDCLRRMAKKSGKPIPSKTELLEAYHELIASGKFKHSEELDRLLRKRSIRTLSGVTIITALTKPFPCPGACIYCPNEPGMPKSYISDEPAAARALTLKFDPYAQVIERIKVLKRNGHPTDKIELIIKGGSWNAYPMDYQYWFILRCFEACNTNSRNVKRESKNFNKKLKVFKIKKLLDIEQKKNETAKHRIIGLTLETRPDLINNETISLMRDLGCTRVELGVQTTDDAVLKLIRRGHTADDTINATKLLKNYGFKVDFHLMPMLPGSTPAKDAKMLARIFSDPNYRPDMVKIYPCTVVKNSPLYKWIMSKKYKPYSDNKLIDLLVNFKSRIPRYVRISRLIRDIPGHHIVAGNKMTNLRQVIQAVMAQKKIKCNCLRCREVGHQARFNSENVKYKLKLFVEKYKASGGDEYFLSYEDTGRNAVFAFCRLRIDINGLYSAFIRELHTYGRALKIGKRDVKTPQHQGLGIKLIKKAENICKKNKIENLAVISGVGVRNYYRKIGYRLNNNYMVKKM